MVYQRELVLIIGAVQSMVFNHITVSKKLKKKTNNYYNVMLYMVGRYKTAKENKKKDKTCKLIKISGIHK